MTPNPRTPNMDDLVEVVAEAIWEAEFQRATGRHRLVPWAEINPDDRERYRFLARAAIAACEATLRAEERERCARIAEKRAEDRFAEYGTREGDTNATYYSGRRGETLEELDEEDEAIANAIRQQEPKP